MKKIDVVFRNGDTESFADSATNSYSVGFRGSFLVIYQSASDLVAYPADKIDSVNVVPIKTDSK